MNFLSLLRAKEPASADLRRELAGLDISGKAAAVVAIQAQRRAMLLDGEVGDALDRIERDLTGAQREHDRAVALDEELRARLAQAEQRERIDALTARKVAAEKEARALAKFVDDRMPPIAADLREMVRRRQHLTAEAAAINDQLQRLGSTDLVESMVPKEREPGPIDVERFILGPSPTGYEGGWR